MHPPRNALAALSAEQGHYANAEEIESPEMPNLAPQAAPILAVPPGRPQRCHPDLIDAEDCQLLAVTLN